MKYMGKTGHILPTESEPLLGPGEGLASSLGAVELHKLSVPLLHGVWVRAQQAGSALPAPPAGLVRPPSCLVREAPGVICNACVSFPKLLNSDFQTPSSARRHTSGDYVREQEVLS